eukprot:gene19361-biopygen17496
MQCEAPGKGNPPGQTFPGAPYGTCRDPGWDGGRPVVSLPRRRRRWSGRPLIGWVDGGAPAAAAMKWQIRARAQSACSLGPGPLNPIPPPIHPLNNTLCVHPTPTPHPRARMHAHVVRRGTETCERERKAHASFCPTVGRGGGAGQGAF